MVKIKMNKFMAIKNLIDRYKMFLKIKKMKKYDYIFNKVKGCEMNI